MQLHSVAFVAAAHLHETRRKLLTPIILNYFELSELIMRKHTVTFCKETTRGQSVMNFPRGEFSV